MAKRCNLRVWLRPDGRGGYDLMRKHAGKRSFRMLSFRQKRDGEALVRAMVKHEGACVGKPRPKKRR